MLILALTSSPVLKSLMLRQKTQHLKEVTEGEGEGAGMNTRVVRARTHSGHDDKDDDNKKGEEGEGFGHSFIKRSVAPQRSWCSWYCWKKVLIGFSILFTLIVIPSLVYYFINEADIIDEHYDLAGMEDLTDADKVSIRVECPFNIKQLQKFVEHYSICPHVKEIGVVSTPTCQTLEGVYFQYVKVSDVL